MTDPIEAFNSIDIPIPIADHVLNKHFGVSCGREWRPATTTLQGEPQDAAHSTLQPQTQRSVRFRIRAAHIANTRPSDVICILHASLSLLLLFCCTISILYSRHFP